MLLMLAAIIAVGGVVADSDGHGDRGDDRRAAHDPDPRHGAGRRPRRPAATSRVHRCSSWPARLRPSRSAHAWGWSCRTRSPPDQLPGRRRVAPTSSTCSWRWPRASVAPCPGPDGHLRHVAGRRHRDLARAAAGVVGLTLETGEPDRRSARCCCSPPTSAAILATGTIVMALYGAYRVRQQHGDPPGTLNRAQRHRRHRGDAGPRRRPAHRVDDHDQPDHDGGERGARRR